MCACVWMCTRWMMRNILSMCETFRYVHKLIFYTYLWQLHTSDDWIFFFVFLAKSNRRRCTNEKKNRDFSLVVFAGGKIPKSLWLSSAVEKYKNKFYNYSVPMDLRHSQCLEKFHNIGVNNFVLNPFFYRHVEFFPLQKLIFLLLLRSGGSKCAKNLMCSRIASEMERTPKRR